MRPNVIRFGLTHQAHPGAQASNVNAPNNDRRGDAATNTSTSLKGAGTADVTTAPGVISTIDVDLKTPRKQDHPAHGSSGHTHTDTEAHVSQ